MNKTLKKTFMIFIIVTISYCLFVTNHLYASDVKNKNAVLIISFKDFAEGEFFYTKKSLEEIGVNTTIASTEKGIAKGTIEVPVDLAIDDLKASDYDAVIFIGGFGVVDEFHHNAKATKIVQEAFNQKKVLAAICSARMIIYQADVIEYQLPVQKPLGQNVLIIDDIILGSGPDDVKLFSQLIVKALKK